jgi:hypothetical protein
MTPQSTVGIGTNDMFSIRVLVGTFRYSTYYPEYRERLVSKISGYNLSHSFGATYQVPKPQN